MAARPARATSVQAYNFRLCYTQIPANRLPHRKPPKYDPARYELLARYFEALVAAGQQAAAQAFWNPIRMPNRKTDINNNGGFSTDFIGANYAYPDADYADAGEDLAGARGLHPRLRLFPRDQPARAREHARRDADLGAGQG